MSWRRSRRSSKRKASGDRNPIGERAAQYLHGCAGHGLSYVHLQPADSKDQVAASPLSAPPLQTGTPAWPSRLLRQTPPSSNHSSFQISTLSFTLSRHSSPAAHPAFRCGAETAINMLSSPISTLPRRCVIAILTSPCFRCTSLAMERSVRRARGA